MVDIKSVSVISNQYDSNFLKKKKKKKAFSAYYKVFFSGHIISHHISCKTACNDVTEEPHYVLEVRPAW